MTEQHEGKLYSTHGKSKRVHIMLDDRADRCLTEAGLHYQSLTGHKVSNSLIIRRALRHLSKHLRDLTARADALDDAEKEKLVEALTIKQVR